MAWDDSAPTKAELNLVASKQPRWDEEPPPEEESIDKPGLLSSAISSLAASNKQGLEQYGGAQKAKENIIRGLLETLPIAGSVAGGAVGGALGAPLGPGAFVTGVEGAGVGAALGAGAKHLGQKYLLNDVDDPNGDVGEKIAKEGAVGLLSEFGGRAIAQPLGWLGGKIAKYAGDVQGKLKPNAAEIEAAAERLGFKAPKALTTEGETIQKIESSLSHSPRFTATPERKLYEEMRSGIEKGGEALEGLKSGESSYQLGSKLKEGLSKEITSAREPVGELYQDINKDLLRIKLQPKITNKSVGILKNDPIFKTKEGAEFLAKISEDLKGLDSVAGLKDFRSNLLKNITQNTSEIDRLRYNKVYDQITNLRDASIQALKETDPFVKASGKSGKEIIDELHNKLALADAAHAENLSQLEKIKAIAGQKGVKSQQGFLRSMNEIPEEKLIERAANVDVKTLKEVQSKFPELYKNAQAAKINDLVERSMDKGGLNVTRFIKNVDKLEPEVADAIFNQEQKQLIKDLRLISKETPPKIGPSGTPEGIQYGELWNPKGYLNDYVKSVLLNKPGLLKQTGSALQSPWLYRLPKGLIEAGGEANK